MSLNFSIGETEAVRKIIAGLEELLQGQVFTLYGEEVIDPSQKIEKLEKDLSDLADLAVKLGTEVFDLQHIIRPDETDTHNINRRIELLAQRIATLESKKKGWLK